MQETQRYLRPNPLEKASLPSMATWWWVRDIFRIGNKKDLDLDDLYEVMDVDKSATVTEKLQRHWDEELNIEKSGKKPSLGRAFVKTFGKLYASYAIWAVLEVPEKIARSIPE